VVASLNWVGVEVVGVVEVVVGGKKKERKDGEKENPHKKKLRSSFFP